MSGPDKYGNYKNEIKNIPLGEFRVIIWTDDDGHLGVSVRAHDESKVFIVDNDLEGDGPHEWIERFSNKTIERLYREDEHA